MNDKQSVFRTFLDQIVDSNNEFIHSQLTQLQEVVLKFLDDNKANIRELDRRKMIMNVKQMQNLSRLQKYIYDSLLIYEGHGVVGMLSR